MADTKIRFQVEGMESIHSGMEQLKRDAESLSSIFETHNANITSQLREQLELLKERNSLLNSSVSNSVGSLSGQNGISSSVDPNGDLGTFLRDLTTKIDSLLTIFTNQGIRINDETISRLGGGMGPQPNNGDEIKQAISRGFLWNSLSTIGQSIYQGAVGTIWAPNSAAESIMQRRLISTTAQSLGSALLNAPNKWVKALGGLINIGSAIFGYDVEREDRTRQIFESSSQQRALMSSLYGLSPNAWVFGPGQEFGGAGFGFSLGQSLERVAEYTKSLGRGVSPRESAGLFALERAFPLSQGEISNLARSYRTVSARDSTIVSDSAVSLYNTLLGTGKLSENRVITNISDYLKILVTLNQSQVDRLGVMSRGMAYQNIGFIGQLASVAPLQIEKIGQISSALDNPISPTNPYQSALLYSSIRKSYGDVGLWGVERIKSEGLLQNQELLQSLFKTAESWSGGNSDLAKLILYKDLLSQYGLNPQDIDILYKSYQATGFGKTPSDFYKSTEEGFMQGQTQLIQTGVSRTPVELIDTATKELHDLNQGLDILSEYSASLEHAGSVIKEAASSIIAAVENFGSYINIYMGDGWTPPINYRP